MASFRNSAFISRAEQRLTILIQIKRHPNPQIARVQSDILAPMRIDKHILRDIGIKQAVMITAIGANA
jgi:hypothetical protein